jgi:hypothetical protein
MCEVIENFDEIEKLGQCFSSTDPLEEIYIGDEITPGPIFINKNVSLEHKDDIIKLIRIYLLFTLSFAHPLPHAFQSVWHDESTAS